MIKVPEQKIIAISYDPYWQSQENIDKVFESLKGKITRDWFVNHAYNCLPIVIGNQYGFVVKSLYDFEAEWNGGNSVEDVKVTILSDRKEYEKNCSLQNISSHFGMGVITVQMAFSLRTSPEINLITINPPNYFIDGLYHMSGVVETDNLRRDFTYNLRLTRSNYKVRIHQGDYIGCIIPYPRHFIDKFTIVDAKSLFNENEIEEEIKCITDFGLERSKLDKMKSKGNGKRYWRGEDVYGNKFLDHQTSLDK
jgi:hypothetical protein